MYTFVPDITDTQRAMFTKAFDDAISIAYNALRPPGHISQGQQAWIFNKYFPLEDQDTVEGIYSKIMGFSPQGGASIFSELVLDAHDSENVCPTQGTFNFMVLDGTTIAVCPDFWTFIAPFPNRDCSDFPDDIVSWRMAFPGSLIFHMLIAYVGRDATEGQSLINFGVRTTTESGIILYTGVANAMQIRYHSPDKAKLSVMNYDWYAVVSLISKEPAYK